MSVLFSFVYTIYLSPLSYKKKDKGWYLKMSEYNDNIDRITTGLAEVCKECITIAYNDTSAKREILRGGGSSGGIMTRLLMPRPISKIRISEDALNLCIEYGVLPFDYFILTPSQLKKKYGNFFGSNEKTIDKCHEKGHYLTGDHNIPNKAMLQKMFKLYENDPTADVSEYKKILNQQSYDLITLEENERLNAAGYKSCGSQQERDLLCSNKIDLVDLWLTPQDVIDGFFKVSGLSKEECIDPCASDGRWLNGHGMSFDILPMRNSIIRKDFLTATKYDIKPGIKTVVGTPPSSILDEFIKKALELTGDCYFLTNGDTVLKHFPNNIEHIYIFSELDGNQKDNRSRCEFSVPFLMKSTLYCCILHITKQKQLSWEVEQDLPSDAKRDEYHIEISRSVFIKSAVRIDDNPKITRIPVMSSTTKKGGKKSVFSK